MSHFKELNLLFNTAGATILNADKNIATWRLKNVLSFPQASSVKVGVSQFSFTNWFANIFASGVEGFGPIIYYSDDQNDLTKYEIDLTDVLGGTASYNFDDFADYVSDSLKLVGHDDWFSFKALPQFQRVQMTVANGKIVTFAAEESPYTLLGFSVYSYTLGKYIGGDVCKFNYTEEVKLKSNLSNELYDNGVPSDTLLSTKMMASPGSTEIINVGQVDWVESSILKSGLNEIKLYVTDQDNNAVPMLENWSAVIKVRAYYD